MLIPGVDFTTIGKIADDVLPLRQRQRRHQRPPDQLHALQRAAQPGAGGGARAQADPERQGRRRRRQHELRRVRHELEVLQEQGLRRDRRRRAGRVLQHPVVRRGELGPALQQRRRGTGARQGRRSRSSRSPRRTRSRRTRTAAPALVAQKAGIPVKIFPTHLPVTDAASQLLQMYQFAGDGGGILLDFTPDTAPAFMKAAEAQGIVDKVKWGSSTPIANTLMSSQFSPAFDGHLWIDNEFSNVDPNGRPGLGADVPDPEEVHPDDRPAGVRADGLPRREVRDERPAQHQGPDHREVVQRGGRRS